MGRTSAARWALAIVLVVAATAHASALVIDYDPCEGLAADSALVCRARHAERVFMGRVLEVREQIPPGATRGDRDSDAATEVSAERVRVYRIFRFRVERVWKGASQDSVLEVVGRKPDMDHRGSDFKLGRRYLVFASRVDSLWMCARDDREITDRRREVRHLDRVMRGVAQRGSAGGRP